MNNVNDDIRDLLSKFDFSEKSTLKESDDIETDDIIDTEPSEDDGFIEDRVRGGYDASVGGKYIGNFDDRDDAEEAIRDAAGPNFFPNIWFIDDHGGVELITGDELSEVKKLAGLQEENGLESFQTRDGVHDDIDRMHLQENVRQDALRVFSDGKGGMKQILDWRDDDRSAEFITNKGTRATIIFQDGEHFVVYDNTKRPTDAGHKLIDSTKDPAPIESLWHVVWGIDEELSEVKKLAGLQEENDEESGEKPIPDWLVKQYEERADSERAAGGEIEIDRIAGTVSIKMSDESEYFFQDHEADELLSRVPDNIQKEDFLLAVAQNW